MAKIAITDSTTYPRRLSLRQLSLRRLHQIRRLSSAWGALITLPSIR